MSLHMLLYMRAGRGVLEAVFMLVHELCKASTYLWFCRDVLSYSNSYSSNAHRQRTGVGPLVPHKG